MLRYAKYIRDLPHVLPFHAQGSDGCHVEGVALPVGLVVLGQVLDRVARQDNLAGVTSSTNVVTILKVVHSIVNVIA